MARMLPREAENGVGMNRSARGGSVKRFERSNGLDTALYKTLPFTFTANAYEHLRISGDHFAIIGN